MSLTRSTCAIAFHPVAEGLISPAYDGLDGRIRANIVAAGSSSAAQQQPAAAAAAAAAAGRRPGEESTRGGAA